MKKRRRQRGRGLFTPTGIVPHRGVIPRKSFGQRGFGSIHDIILAKTRKKWKKLLAQTRPQKKYKIQKGRNAIDGLKYFFSGKWVTD